MSIAATNDPGTSGTDSAQPSSDLNDPLNLDFEDDSDAPNDVQEAKAGTDPKVETDEADRDDSQEADESEQEASTDEGEPEAEASAEVSIPDNALVTLQNGEKVKFSDLRESPMLKADYTRKMQQLGNERGSLNEQATRLQSVTENFVNFIASQLPPEPDAALAWTDPTKHYQQKVTYDAAVARLQSVIDVSEAAKAEGAALSDTQLKADRKAAAEAIADRLPFLRDPVKAREFDKNVSEAAQFLGIPQDAVARMHKPHEFLLAHYAALGIKAEQAGKKVAAKVQAAPQSTPAKTASNKGNPQFLRAMEAKRRFEKSGTIADAMAIDFD